MYELKNLKCADYGMIYHYYITFIAETYSHLNINNEFQCSLTIISVQVEVERKILSCHTNHEY